MSYRSPGRFLAPLALLAAVVAVALVVSSATGGEDDGGSAGKTGSSSSTNERGASSNASDAGEGSGGDAKTATTGGSSRKTYRVKPGDTLGSIAEANGLSIEELQDLNPEVDPQSLTVGQRLRLRR